MGGRCWVLKMKVGVRRWVVDSVIESEGRAQFQ